MKLAAPYITPPSTSGEKNVNAYEQGGPPRGFPGWPYKKVHLMDTVIRQNVQLQVDQLHRKYTNQHEHPPSLIGSDIDTVEEDRNGPPSSPPIRPFEGKACSDSD